MGWFVKNRFLFFFRIHRTEQFRQVAEASDQPEYDDRQQHKNDRYRGHYRRIPIAQGVENFNWEGFNRKAGHHVGHDIFIQT